MNADERRACLKQFEAACRARGLAVTVQRRRILELLLGRTDHPTADEVYAEVQEHLPGVSRTTVYRVLDTLVELGVITKAASPGAAVRFDPTTRRHHHLVCLHCDRLIDLADDALDVAIRLPKRAGPAFEIQDYSVHFTGVCAACRRKRGSKAAALRARGHGRRKAGAVGSPRSKRARKTPGRRKSQ
jgi:Fur family peroxide stress response transcriptional regulator